jgi:signal transduction histidine kinase
VITLYSKAHQLWLARRRWSEDRQIILDFNRSLTLIVDPDSLMASTAARIKELFKLECVIILRALTDPGVLTVAFSTDWNDDGLKDIQLHQDNRLAKWLLINESPLIVAKDSDVFNYLTESEREILVRLNARACVPLLALNRLTGVMVMATRDKDWKLHEYELGLLQMLMGSASIALENAFLYQQQRDRLRRLYRAERLAAAGQLAASVAHEIRNPLTGIRSTVQYLLGECEENPARAELIKGVIEEVDRIDRTVDGLLSLTRGNEFKPQKLVIGDLIEQTLLLIKQQVHNQSVDFTWSGLERGLSIIGDAQQLKQLFLNLILNSLQAMPDSGRLDVSMVLKAETIALGAEKDWVHISIADTGCGIPPELIDKIFDPFFTTKPKGTGLGLSTSYAVIQQHGGEVEVNSTVGEGTTVTVRFPVVY